MLTVCTSSFIPVGNPCVPAIQEYNALWNRTAEA